MLTASLPYPPSANRLWRNVSGKTLISEDYRHWKVSAMADLIEQGLGKLRRNSLAGAYHLTLLADRPDRRRRDLGNLLKATEDLLTQAGVIEDDCLAQSITLRWSSRPPGAKARIHLMLEAAT